MDFQILLKITKLINFFGDFTLVDCQTYDISQDYLAHVMLSLM